MSRVPLPAPVRRRYRRLLAAAGAAVAVERAWPALWSVFATAGGFLALALLDVLPRLPGWLHLAVLAGFAGAGLWTGRHLLRSLSPVGRAAAQRRLEADSALDHQPLAVLDDTLAAGRDDPVAEALWQRHRAAAVSAVERLRLRPPAPEMARRDPRALRVLVVLALAVGLAVGLDDPGARLGRALAPDLGGFAGEPVVVDVWITPPPYTRAAPLNLRHVADGGPAAAGEIPPGAPVAVPAGSRILAQVRGVGAPPVLRTGGKAVPFAALGEPDSREDSGWRVEHVAVAGDRLGIAVGRRTLAEWPLRIVSDRPPEIGFAEVPQATPAAMLSLRYRGRDDYGITALAAVITHADGQSAPDGTGEIRIDLAVSAVVSDGRSGEREVEGSELHDLTPHAWAGEPVRMRLEAADAAGQVGRSDVVETILPERQFSHPVARAVIAERKQLVEDSREVRERVARGLATIASQPEHFGRDTVVSLALGVAASRLRHDHSAARLGSVRSILWQTALRLEQGSVPVAEQRLRDARDRLWEALRSDRDAAELEQLIDELEQALNDYLKALAAELARQGEAGEPVPGVGDVVTDQDLRDLLDATRDLARAGARESARQLLSELQRILDQIRSGLRAPSQTQELVQAHRLMNNLRDLAARQQALLDRTFEAHSWFRENGSRRGPDSQPPESAVGLTEQQDALRRDLGAAMRDFAELMGGIPAPLGEAERAMKDAGDALGQGRFNQAMPSQGSAVEKLRSAMEQAASMIGQRFGPGQGRLSGAMADGEEGGADPFGRSGAEGFRGFDGKQVDIPDRMEMRRVEEILLELRRRAGEFSRPQRELDYIDRLLRRF